MDSVVYLTNALKMVPNKDFFIRSDKLLILSYQIILDDEMFRRIYDSENCCSGILYHGLGVDTDDRDQNYIYYQSGASASVTTSNVLLQPVGALGYGSSS